MISVLVGVVGVAGAALAGAAGASKGVELQDKVYDKAYREGYEAASRMYEEKYRKLIADFECDRDKLRREMNKYKQLCKELLEKCEEYERMGYSELADRAKNDYYRLRNAA